MPLGLLGKKIGMTRLFDEATQSMTVVTVVDVKGNTFPQHKTIEKDGYKAVQVGYGDQKEQRVNKASLGNFKKANATPKRKIQEFRMTGSDSLPEIHPGAELFTVGQFVDVIGTTKGHGFTGVVKRYKFGGLRMTHGSMMHRRTGAIGCRSTPGRVWKNQKMPGQDGNSPRTVQNLKIVAVRPEDGVILISGAVPGSNGGFITVRPAKKKTVKA
jgi:large subunit ribosomal protein L3